MSITSKKLLVVIGPTATGKTNLALGLAKKFNGELISADSRQIYRGMDIGTGKELDKARKVIKEEGQWIVDSVPIHLYDVITPDKTFSVAEYQQLAYQTIQEIHSRGKLPILVGGTGLYVQAVVEGLKIPKVPPDLKLRGKLERKPLSYLVAEIEKVDPETAAKVDQKNPRRIIRALEVYYLTGQPFSTLQQKFLKTTFDFQMIGLIAPREVLYERADNRIGRWFKEGFVKEVEDLLKQYPPELPAMSGIGYRQVAAYLQKKLSLEEAIQRTKFDTHGYIRRQLTWFKRDSRIFWFDITEPDFRIGLENLIGEWYNRQD